MTAGNLLETPLLLLPENRAAWQALSALSRLLSKREPRSVYLYGPPGAGKSLLCRHFLTDLRRRQPLLRVRSLLASEFADLIDHCEQQEDWAAFREDIHELDVLVCEDLQALTHRPESQQQLVIAWDRIVAHGGSVVVSALKLPRQLGRLNHRLTDRCHGSVSVHVPLPAADSRRRLLDHLSRTNQIPVPAAILDYLAQQRDVAPRELAGLLHQLEAAARQARSTRITFELTQQVLERDAVGPDVTVAQIARTVARYYRVPVRDMRSAVRRQSVTVARQIAMYLCHRITSESMRRIAEYFGRANHSAVSYACERVERMRLDEAQIRSQLDDLTQELGVAAADRNVLIDRE